MKQQDIQLITREVNGAHRIRIAYLIDTISCDTSGTEKQLLEVITQLDKKRFHPHLVCLHDSVWIRGNSLPCSFTILGYEGLLKNSLYGVVQKLRRLIHKNDIQIIQTFFEDSIFVAWLATRFYQRKIVLLSSRRDMGLGEGNQPWYHRLFSLTLPFVNRSFDGIVANSCRVREYVVKREKIARNKIEVIYNGVDLPRKVKDTPQVFTDYPGNKWIVIVASLTPVKRHDLLIKAVSCFASLVNGQKIKILVLGKGPLKDQIVSLIKRENVEDLFLFEGAVQNVTDYLQHCDLGVLCSDREGFSNAILEYMACCLPVIATAVGGNIELVNKDNGICVPADNPTALADALHELIVDQKRSEQMGRMSRKRVEDDFSWPNSMQHLGKYYERKVLDKGIGK